MVHRGKLIKHRYLKGSTKDLSSPEKHIAVAIRIKIVGRNELKIKEKKKRSK